MSKRRTTAAKPVKEASFDAFDFVVVVFLNIGKFGGGYNGRRALESRSSTRSRRI